MIFEKDNIPHGMQDLYVFLGLMHVSLLLHVKEDLGFLAGSKV